MTDTRFVQHRILDDGHHGSVARDVAPKAGEGGQVITLAAKRALVPEVLSWIVRIPEAHVRHLRAISTDHPRRLPLLHDEGAPSLFEADGEPVNKFIRARGAERLVEFAVEG